MNWLLVFHVREEWLWRLVHRSGAVLAELRATHVYRPQWDVLWDCVTRDPAQPIEEGEAEVRHLRDVRVVRADLMARFASWENDPSPPSLSVEPIARESWRKRRAKKRAETSPPQYIELIAGESLARFQYGLVRLNEWGQVVSCGPGDFSIGILQNAPNAGESATVRIVATPRQPVDNNENP